MKLFCFVMFYDFESRILFLSKTKKEDRYHLFQNLPRHL